jgi:hypothetical protein
MKRQWFRNFPTSHLEAVLSRHIVRSSGSHNNFSIPKRVIIWRADWAGGLSKRVKLAGRKDPRLVRFQVFTYTKLFMLDSHPNGTLLFHLLCLPRNTNSLSPWDLKGSNPTQDCSNWLDTSYPAIVSDFDNSERD